MKNSVPRIGKNPKSSLPALSENVDDKQDAWPPVITSPLKLVVPLTNSTSFTFVAVLFVHDLGRRAERFPPLQLLSRSPQRSQHKLPLLPLLPLEFVLHQARRQQRRLQPSQQAFSLRPLRADLLFLPPLRRQLARRPRERTPAGKAHQIGAYDAAQHSRAGHVQLQEEPVSEAVLRVFQEPGILFQRV